MSDRRVLAEQIESRPLGMAIMHYYSLLMGPELVSGIQDDIDQGYSPDQVAELLSSIQFDSFVVECGWAYATLYSKGVIRLEGRDGGQAENYIEQEER